MITKIKKIINGWWRWIILLLIPFAFAAGPGQNLFNSENIPVYTLCNISEQARVSVDSARTDLKVRNPDNSLRGLNGKEWANLKGCEIAKIFSIPREVRKGYDIEVVSMNPIEGGVEVFARAWDENGQIGFGKDGTVDIERFVFNNPPILVRDIDGDIVREWTDSVTGELKQKKFREDLTEAILQDLEHTIKVKTQKFGNENIIAGKIGSTTLTARPAAGANTPVDGDMKRNAVNEIFGTIVAGAGTNVAVSTTVEDFGIVIASATTDQFQRLSRGGFGFDTSSIGSDQIDSATMSLSGSVTTTVLGDVGLNIVQFDPASEDDLVTGDFGTFGSTDFSTSILASNFNSSPNDFIFNASGEADINKSGNSFFGTRLDWDIDNSFGGTWQAGDNSRIQGSYADVSGTIDDPVLVVEHSVAPVAVPSGNITWTQ